MRRISRPELDANVKTDLSRRQTRANNKRTAGTLKTGPGWDNARTTDSLKKVLSILKKMMGPRERCMYCLDSEGSDIEHFWPKASYPHKMFQWTNMLLCCTPCGRLKGSQIPLTATGLPLLINPTEEDPWTYLDFDPDTGNIVARFDLETNEEVPKGRETVALLQLDRREALSNGYRRTFLRLSKVVERYLNGEIADEEMLTEMKTIDDHGLLSWCFLGTGQKVSPFLELHQKHVSLWEACEASMRRLSQGET